MINQPDPAELFRAAGLRFADYYRSLAEQNKEANEILAEELENLLYALMIYQDTDAWSDASLLIHALDVFLDGQGYWDALKFWLENILKHASDLNNANILVANTLSLAHLSSSQGERKRSIEIYHQAIELGEKNADAAQLAQAYFGLGTVFF